MSDRRELGFGLIALRTGRVDPARFLEAGEAWLSDPNRGFAEVLADHASLSADDREAIERQWREAWTSPDETAPAASRDFSLGGIAEAWGAANPSTTEGRDRRGESEGNGAGDGPDFGLRYESPALHGQGGVGRVWSVWDRTLGRRVALKQLRPDRASDPILARRLIAEAEITARLAHPNIVPVFELSTFTDPPYYTMPLLGSRTLRDEIHEFHQGKAASGFSGEPASRLIDAVLAVSDAIAHAHSKGVIHRDIKARNVIIGPFREVIVLDWGLAKALDGPDPLDGAAPETRPAPDRSLASTRPGEAVGTPNCMAPEQALGDHERIGRTTDIFGLGALLYTVLTNRNPYTGTDVQAVLELARNRACPEPVAARRDVPPALQAICLKAMAPDPASRYQSAEAFADDLRRWRDDRPVVAYPDGARARLNRWARKNPSTVVGSLAILLTLLPALGFYAYGVGREKEEAVEARGLAEMATRSETEAKNMARADFASSMAVTGDLLRAMAEELPSLPGSAAETLRQSMAMRAFGHAVQIAKTHTTDPTVITVVGDLLVQVAGALENSSRPAEADQAYLNLDRMENWIGVGDQATPERLAKAPPELLDHAARFRIARGTMLQRRDTPKASQALFERAAALSALALAREPNSPAFLRTEADALRGLGVAALDQGDAKTAETFLRRAVERRRQIPAEAGYEANDARLRAAGEIEYGRTLAALGRLPEAREAFARALKETASLMASAPDLTDHVHLNGLARMEHAFGGGPEAVAEVADAVDRFARFQAAHPQVNVYLVELADARVRQAESAREAGDSDRAAKALDAAESDLAELIRRLPDLPSARSLSGRVAACRARLRVAAGDAPGAEAELARAREALAKGQALRGAPGPDPEDEKDLAEIRAGIDAIRPR